MSNEVRSTVVSRENSRPERSLSSPKTGDEALGQRIRDRRRELGMRRRDLAEATELSYPYVAQIETGYRLPSSRHQLTIARTLGMSLDELFGSETGSDTRPAPRRRPAPRSERRRPTIDDAIEKASAEIEALPASVRLEALSRIQLRIMQGVTESQARERRD